MKILVCCDFYSPSIGGVQTVLQQISERLVLRGHQVTVATSYLIERKELVINGVKIKEFDVSGNSISGLSGQIKEYKDYVLKQDYDVLLLKAAQTWSFDILMDELEKIQKRKIFIPCGFSGLYYDYYRDYYKKMPNALNKFDHLIFYAENYRDINFTKEHNINHYSIIPNGASEAEFNMPKDDTFRDRLGINKNDFVILTVGTFTGGKGHTELANAYNFLNIDNPSVLILNGNYPEKKAKFTKIQLFKNYLRMGPKSLIKRLFVNLLVELGLKDLPIDKNWEDYSKEINASSNNKKVLITNLDRHDLIQAYLNADLFVFTSNIEYSPLVLYESAAAGLPFITVPVGNSTEIANWTKGGIICDAPKDQNERTVVDPKNLAQCISELISDKEKRVSLGKAGRKNWERKYTWDIITSKYENVLKGIL